MSRFYQSARLWLLKGFVNDILISLEPRLSTIISGESLFNDGVSLILFVIILGITQKPGEGSFAEIPKIFAQEIVGGIIIVLILGFLGIFIL
ncbi:cation:proton antiporter domain-containing protein [Pedobacter jamesrossensis]|uniref:Cation:proton antiporter n=1 Tax=Pedobacter jamesrossensis TaxID=1908238 RepID=A0ABV8NMA3_9SPHI